MIRRIIGALFLVLPLIVGGCERAAAVAPQNAPAPKVTAAKPIVRDVTQWDEYTGRLAAVEQVEVKAQVSGFVESVSFTEGALVKKGDLLLTIDSRIFEAQLDSTKADLLQARAKLEQAQATLQLAQNDFKRGQQAASTGGISAEELDTRRATVAKGQADVSAANASIAAAEASQKTAALNVEWCRITAPISGKISNRRITPGNMLTGGPGTSTTTVTTIETVDPIYCYVDVDEAAVLRYQKLAREERRVSAEQAQVACYMQLGNETGFPHTGVVDFVDNRINSDTATRRARGVFPNSDGGLLPGNFAKLRVAGEELKSAMLVMDDCIGLDQDKRYLYVLKPDQTVERRTVVIGPLEGELRVIRANLKPDELVLVNGIAGLTLIRPDTKVNPDIVTMPERRLGTLMPPTAAASKTSPATAQAASTASSRPQSGAEGGK